MPDTNHPRAALLMSAPHLPELSLEQSARARALFDEAVVLPPGERADDLGRSCGSDRALHEAIEALLAADAAPRAVLDASPAELS